MNLHVKRSSVNLINGSFDNKSNLLFELIESFHMPSHELYYSNCSLQFIVLSFTINLYDICDSLP